MAEMLRVQNVSRRFGGLLALDRASFTFADEGQIVALIGPNGAGKTTLFAIITGFLRAHEGRVRYHGDDITGEPPHLLARRGIARTFQIAQPFAGLTVRENIAVGTHLSRRSARRCARRRRGGRAGGRPCADARSCRPRASRSPGASGSSLRARSRSSRSCCCSTRCSPGSIRPRSATWCR